LSELLLVNYCCLNYCSTTSPEGRLSPMLRTWQPSAYRMSDHVPLRGTELVPNCW
jgi:hypothetical protein